MLRKFIKEEIQIVNKHTESGSSSLVVKEMEMKI